MSPHVPKKVWEKSPELNIELTEKEMNLLNRLRELLGSEYSPITALTLLQLLRE